MMLHFAAFSRRGAYKTVAAAVLAGLVLAQRSFAGGTSAGDIGLLMVPYSNFSATGKTLRNVRLTLTNTPEWFEVQQSRLGPSDIAPGAEQTFQVLYRVGSSYPGNDVESSIDISVTMDNSDVYPASVLCHLRSADGLRTTHLSCEADGQEIVQKLFPDRTPPVTTFLPARGPFRDIEGKVFVSTAIPIYLEAQDPDIPGNETSGVNMSRFLIDPPSAPLSADELGSYSSGFSLAEGQHQLFYASVDGAGNREPVRSITVFADGALPTTSVVFSGDSVEASPGVLVISTSTAIEIHGSDPISGGIASGLSRIVVSTDNSGAFLYEGPFVLPQGVRRLSFGGVDNAENAEPDHFLTLYVGVPADIEAPNTELTVMGSSSIVAGRLTIQMGSSITAVAQDLPATDGSGVNRTFLLIDLLPSACVGGYPSEIPNPAMPFGTCENAVFTGPFQLGLGIHELRYWSSDNAGNTEVVQSMQVEVQEGGPQNGNVGSGLALSSDAEGNLWTVLQRNESFVLVKFSPSGQTLGQVDLPDAAGAGRWTVAVDGGHVFAVGGIQGGITKSDVAVYDVSGTANTLLGRYTLQPPLAADDFPLSSAGRWATGVMQLAEDRFALALWRFSPEAASISETARYSGPGGFDAGFGVAVDSAGIIWISGISGSIGGQTSLALAVWRYDPSGLQLLSRPLVRENFFSSVDDASAKVIARGNAVWLVASRRNASGGSDLAVFQFGLDGTLKFETSWHSAEGYNETPLALAFDEAGDLVIGGRVRSTTGSDHGAWWRFQPNGLAVEAKLTGEASAVNALASSGNVLWAAGDGRSAPFSLGGGTTLPGAWGVEGQSDSSPPETFLLAGGEQVQEGTIAVSEGAPLSLQSQDPESGIAQTRFLIDADPTACDNVPYNSGATPGTCANPSYSAPFILAAGSHTVFFASVDLAGNEELPRRVELVVGSQGGVLLAPTTGLIGIPFTITGYGFGAYAGGATRVLFGSTSAPVSLWSDTTIKGTVPNVPEGAWPVSIERRHVSSTTAASAGVFTLRPPTITSVSPSSGPIGVSFSIAGSGFGPYAGTLTRVLFGGTTAAISVWNDSLVQGTVPGVPSGIKPIVMERASSDGGLMGGEIASFHVLTPAPTGIEPSSAPIGTPFTITGSGFGAYAGALSRVLMAGVPAPVSLWNDTTIKGTIPGVASAVQPIVIERETGGFIARSDEGQLQVLTPNLTAFQPEAGPIGIAFTATGSGFGPYAGTLTRMLIGGATAAVSLWNDSTIKGTVPGNLAPGVQPVLVERVTSDGGMARSNALTFNLELPAVYAMSPTSGPIGVPFTLIGTDFGNYTGSLSQVKFGGVPAPVSLWTNTTIQGTIPGVSPGSQEVLISRQSGASTMTASVGSFLVVAPQALAISPSSGPSGVPFTITGSGFGSYAGTLSRLLIGGIAAPVSLWNDTTIAGTIPASTVGPKSVVVERQTSSGFTQQGNALAFDILTTAASAVSPSSAPIGAPFTVTGAGFGPYAGTLTRVKIGGVIAPVSLWNDTTIKGTVPNAAAGMSALVIERQTGSQVDSSSALDFQVLVPEVAALAPSSAPIGAPFTIIGAGFGPYAGTLSRVKFGGVVAPVSLWNDTTIKGTVPGAVAAGPTAVVVERATSDGGLSSGVPSGFEVLTPFIAAISPGYGLQGSAFTLSGNGFGPYAGTATRVKLGGVSTAVSLWNDTTIRAIVPDSLSIATYPVVVERSPAGGVAASNEVVFAVGSTPYNPSGYGFAASRVVYQPDWYQEATLLLPASEGGRVEAPSRASVSVPAHALEEDRELTIRRAERMGRDKDEREGARSAAALASAGEALEFGPEGTRFSAPVTLELPYDALSLPPGGEAKLALHYWNRELKLWEPLLSEIDTARKRVRARTDHFSLYQPLVPASASALAAAAPFQLGEVYAYPNPARPGQRPTFHIEAGSADSVELRVYDVSGRLVHSASDLGPKTTFELPWDAPASGVYLYTVTAKKAGGGDLHAKGRLGVVR